MTKHTVTTKVHSLSNRFMQTCHEDAFLLILAALIISFVHDEPDTITKNACMIISWMSIGGAITRIHLKLFPKN